MKNAVRFFTVGLGMALSYTAAGQQQDNVVTIYGTLMPIFENVKVSGATSGVPSGGASQVAAGAYTGVNDPPRNRVVVGTSNIGFRGVENLGGGLRALFQIESGVPIDGSAGPNTFASRNSHVGLEGPWGGVSIGQWDTPYKIITLAMNSFRAGYVFDYTPVLGNPGMGVPVTTTQAGRLGAKPDAAFDRRQGNLVQYWTPTTAGFSARIAYSANEGKTSATATTPSINPVLWSLNMIYDIDGLSLRYGFERHSSYFGLAQIGGSAGATAANPSSTDTGHKVVAIYKIGKTRISGAFERLDYKSSDSTATGINEYKKNSFYAIVEQSFGADSVWLAYGKAQEGSCSRVNGTACVTSGLGGRETTLGYVYKFSKRTEAFGAYYQIKNDVSGTYTTQPTVGATVAPGGKTTGISMGLIHYF
ncbi:MAG: porin [Betaproteobacteria bacterium]|nr:porin [Betaproteobacteria bacterium]